jgi:hypothetical protein
MGGPGPVTQVVTMSPLLLPFLVLAAAPAVHESSKPELSGEPPLWEVFAGAMGGVRGARVSPSGGLILGFNRRVTRWLRPEVVLGQGYSVNPRMHQTMLRFGTRVQWPVEGRWVPYAWLAFAHNHETLWEHFVADPTATLLGLSSHGSGRLSGAEGGLGISVELPKRASDRVAGRLNARVVAAHMWGTAVPIRIDGLVSLGVCF